MTEHDNERSATNGGPSSAGTTRGVTEEVRGAARDLLDETRATANALKSEAGGLAGTIKEGLASKAEQQKNVVADRLGQVASHLQKSAGDLREHEAWLATLIERGARELEHVADDIKRNDIAGIMGSAEVFARRQPALFMGAAVALGFALTRVVRTSALAGDDHETYRSPYGGAGQPAYGRPGQAPGYREFQDRYASQPGSGGASVYGADRMNEIGQSETQPGWREPGQAGAGLGSTASPTAGGVPDDRVQGSNV